MVYFELQILSLTQSQRLYRKHVCSRPLFQGLCILIWLIQATQVAPVPCGSESCYYLTSTRRLNHALCSRVCFLPHNTERISKG